jgi:hypothetical protein
VGYKVSILQEIGKEIDERLVKDDGKNSGEIIARLEFIRRSVGSKKSVQGLVSSLRVARGKPSFGKGKATDIRQLLE